MFATNIKAMLVVLPLLAAAFLAARLVFTPAISAARLGQWRNAFLAVTAIGFLIPNFWVATLAAAAAALALTAGEKSRPAVYLLLLCALPPASKILPGFAGINNFLAVTPQAVLAAAILAPCLFAAGRMRKAASAGGLTDVFFLGFAGLTAILAFRDTTVTDGFRKLVTFLLVAGPQYWVLSRWPRSGEEMRVIAAAIAISILALCAVALAEFALSWHFYAGLNTIWLGASSEYYLFRGGFLRTYASVSGPIAFGYLIMVAMVLAPPLMRRGFTGLYGLGAAAGYAAGLATTLSRGPWVGAAIAFATFVLTGPKAVTRAVRIGLALVAALALLSPTPIGKTLISFLPVIGEAADAEDTISYRQRLLDTGTAVLLETPLFGSTDFSERPEMQALIQGQGIIDYVNSYLHIGLQTGFVGLALFAGMHLTALAGLWRAVRMTRRELPEFSALCRAFFAAYIGVLFTIATVSSIPPLETFNFVMAALAVALRRVAAVELGARQQAPAPAPSPETEEPKRRFVRSTPRRLKAFAPT